jgi:uncharacterized protein (DUF488 family)
LLGAHGITRLADIRRYAGSRRYPHFNPGPLAQSLAEAGIEYTALPELGGRRPPRPDSPNTAWRNESFRGYADYMETEAFAAGQARLLCLARERPTAMMCAEALWWRCHRALVADALKIRGVEVWHITSAGNSELHPYTPVARLLDGRLSYAAGQPARPPDD